jgi:hypothetical protein
MKVFYLALESDAAFIERATRALACDGHEITAKTSDRFPIADALAHVLISAAKAFDAVVVVLTEDGGREQWVGAEVATLASMSDEWRFAVVGAPVRSHERVTYFATKDPDALQTWVRGIS